MESLKRFTETLAVPIALVLGAPAREQKRLGADKILFNTGRFTAEIVMKAVGRSRFRA